MAGLCGLKILLLCAGIINSANSAPPSQCSYTVTPIKFGFKIDITSVNIGNYNINITEVGRPETAKTSSVQYPDSSHEILHLKPCTEYEHNVAFIDSTGKETHCTHTENKTTTTGMSKDDVEDIRCTPGYVCYRSEWDISSSLSASNKIPAEPCRSDKKAFCIKPGFNDICSELTTTFTSGNCVNSFSFTTSIRVDFLNPSEIQVTAPTGLPANINTTLPPNCNDLTIDYTCLEQQNKSKNLSVLEPFTDYSCTGQIKDNNVPIKNTNAVEFQIDCDPRITITQQSATNTSIDLSWTTTSKNCQDVLPHLQKFSYDCSCSSDTTKQTQKITGNKHPTGGKCHVAGLKPYQHYTCKVFATYNSKEVGRQEVKQKTEIGIPERITGLKVNVPENNVIEVTCSNVRNWNGPTGVYIAHLNDGSILLKNKTCKFEFKDLSNSATYKLTVTVYNGEHYSEPETEFVTTLYNDKALIGFLVFLITIILIILAVVVFVKCRNGVNEDKILKSTAIYVNVRPPPDSVIKKLADEERPDGAAYQIII